MPHPPAPVEIDDDGPTIPDVHVGAGQVTISGIMMTVGGAALAVAAGISTFVGALPAGVSPAIGTTLTVVAGVLSAAGLAITAIARNAFAKVKVDAARIQPRPIIESTPPVPDVGDAGQLVDPFGDAPAGMQ